MVSLESKTVKQLRRLATKRGHISKKAHGYIKKSKLIAKLRGGARKPTQRRKKTVRRKTVRRKTVRRKTVQRRKKTVRRKPVNRGRVVYRNLSKKKKECYKRKVGRVMHEYKHGTLYANGGYKVKSRQQALAIAINSARRHCNL